jgi:hypothetical protein
MQNVNINMFIIIYVNYIDTDNFNLLLKKLTMYYTIIIYLESIIVNNAVAEFFG